MSDGAVSRLWQRIRKQVTADADHLHELFFPQFDGVTMTADDSYVRIWLSELFLAKEVSWGVERSPAYRSRSGCSSAGSALRLSPRSYGPRSRPGTGSSRTIS